MGSFLNNRAKEADEAKRKLDDAITEERSKPPEQRDEARLRGLTEQYLDAEKWSSGGTYRRYATAIAGAVTGNLSASSSQFIQAAAVNYLQGLGAEEVKRIADNLQSEAARSALQGILGCAGAMAKEAACGAGALGASAGTVINALLQSAERPGSQEKESRTNLVTSIVAGIATAAGSAANPTATLANFSADSTYDHSFLLPSAASVAISESLAARLQAQTGTHSVHVHHRDVERT